MIYCFDLDDTICFPNHNETDSYLKYYKASPNERMIKKIRQLHKEGHTIIINSSRRMLTHNGNIQKIEEDVGQLTMDWLTLYDVPYDTLLFGKPYADFYIDDKAVDLKTFLGE